MATDINTDLKIPLLKTWSLHKIGKWNIARNQNWVVASTKQHITSKMANKYNNSLCRTKLPLYGIKLIINLMHISQVTTAQKLFIVCSGKLKLTTWPLVIQDIPQQISAPLR